MDCNMPIMDGFEASIKINQLYQNNEIHHKPYICALTAYTTDAFKEKCFNCGMDDY